MFFFNHLVQNDIFIYTSFFLVLLNDFSLIFNSIFFWYGDHSDRVTSDLVSISVIKSIHVLFGTIDGKSMGISESCRPFKYII